MLFATATLFLVKVFSLHHFALLTDVERVDRTVVPHHPRPHFTSGPVAVLDTVLLQIILHYFLLLFMAGAVISR